MKAKLTDKGFELRNSKHHDMYWLFANGKKTSVHTFFSHGQKKYDKQLLAEVKNQIHLNDWGDFDDFMDCKMSGESYLKKMIEDGWVTLEKAT